MAIKSIYRVTYRYAGRLEEQIAVVTDLCIDSFLALLEREGSTIRSICTIPSFNEV
jgi:hypothetical protein